VLCAVLPIVGGRDIRRLLHAGCARESTTVAIGRDIQSTCQRSS